ncbi:MAG: ADP-ribosylglycohydrolase family protein [Acidimicrobiia bacterium]
MPTLDQVQGLLLGHAVGDMAGAPFEFMDYVEFRATASTYRGNRISLPGIHPRYPNKFAYTTDDDAHMNIVGQSFVTMGCFDMDDICRRFIEWYNGGDAPGIGGSTALALNLLDPLEQKYPVHWTVAGKEARNISPSMHQGRNNEQGFLLYSFPSNGPLMRVPILGLFAKGRELERNVHDLTRITHDYQVNYVTSAIAAKVVEMIVEGMPKTEIKKQILDKYKKVIQRCEHALKPYNGEAFGIRKNYYGDYPKDFGLGGSAEVTLAIALRAFFETDNFDEAICFGVNARNTVKEWCWDVDTYTALIGAFAGCYYGANSIGNHWRYPVHPATGDVHDITPISCSEILSLGKNLHKTLGLQKPIFLSSFSAAFIA